MEERIAKVEERRVKVEEGVAYIYKYEMSGVLIYKTMANSSLSLKKGKVYGTQPARIYSVNHTLYYLMHIKLPYNVVRTHRCSSPYKVCECVICIICTSSSTS